jgi:2-phospho-L-lactate guanylyltransferase
MSCWALVPVKTRAEGKTRLASVLTPEARIALVRFMLRHVLDVLAAAPGIDHVAVLSPERDEVPQEVLVLNENGHGLNPALGWAIAALRGLGAREVVVLPGDLPWLTVDDVESLLVGVRSSGCALGADDNGTGTNAVAIDLERLGGTAFRFSFGKNSLALHRRQAGSLGLEARLVHSASLAFDVDEPSALCLFMADEKPTHGRRSAS